MDVAVGEARHGMAHESVHLIFPNSILKKIPGIPPNVNSPEITRNFF